MSLLSFVCDAIYRGSEIVEGAVSPTKLTSLAEVVLNAEQAVKGYAEVCIDKLPRGERCQLQIDEERLRVSSSRKDEGFESDSESSSTSSGSVIEETMCASPEIKVIDDHVLRLEKLIRQDSGIHHCSSKTATEDTGSTSISSSSGAESEEESPKRQQTLAANTSASNKAIDESLDSRKTLHGENGNGDNFLLSDILFCHVMSHKPKVVIVVVKSVDSHIVAAHLFECLSQQAARTLYNCYYTASNKYKLNRYRKSKRRGEGIITSDDKAILDRIHVSIRNIRRNIPEECENSSKNNNSNYINNADDASAHNQTNIKFNLSENSDVFSHRPFHTNSHGNSANVNVIEIKDTHFPARVPNGMMQRIDENGVTHIEIESAPCSLISPFQGNNSSSSSPICSTTSSSEDSQEALSALDRLSLHSSNNPDSYLNFVGVTSSCPNSLITSASREFSSNGEREKERKLRQRQPPLLIKKEALRKVDSLVRKEIRKRGERLNKPKDDVTEDGRPSPQCNVTKIQNEHAVILYDNSYNSNIDIAREISKKETFLAEIDLISAQRQSRLRSTLKMKESKMKPKSNHNKGPAPPPPPRKHPNNPSLTLVPTKSGQENTRAYYPKETHAVRGSSSSKLVRIDYPLYPPWNMNSDINNNPKRLYYAHPGWIRSHEYHAPRYNDSSSSYNADLHKRSRSKSPARRPMAHRYIDAVSTFNLSQKLKDFSDTVIQNWKNTAPAASSSSPNLFPGIKENHERISGRNEKKLLPPFAEFSKSQLKGDACLRPVIKRGKKIDSATSNGDSRRVTFNAYATVQVMDS